MSDWTTDAGGWDAAPSASGGGDDGWNSTPSGDGWGSSGTSAPGTGGGRGGRGGGRGGRGGGGGGGGDRGCFNCGESGHMSRDCSAPRKPREGGGGGDRGCFNCGESGHMSRDCTAPRKPRENCNGGGSRSCYNCGGTGHMSRECPQPKKPRENGASGGGGGWNSGGASNADNAWGSSETLKTSGDDGGWGPIEPVKPKSNNDSWGPSKPASSNNDDNGWGPSEAANSKKDDDGWSSNDKNISGFGAEDGARKKFKRDEENGGASAEERPAPYRPEELNLEEEAKFQANGVGENFHRYHDQEVTCIPEGIVNPVEKFEDIVASKLLLDNIKSQKYSEMTPIQKWAMPIIMNDHDLIGCAQTGSGKTAAFLLPVLQTLLNSDLQPNDPNNECQNPYCLILSPTRELANQIHVHASMLAKDSIIQCRVIYGQMATAHLKAKLQQGCHILVATVGRLKDFVQRGWIGFSNIKYIILDEGDRLVDEGFSTEIRGFFEHPSMPPKEKRQTLFFSATFKQETQLQAKEYLKDPFVFLTVGRIGAANLDIKQEFLKVTRQEKKRELKRILSEVPEDKKTIVFTQTKSAADMLAGFFTALNLSSTSIHGDRHQSQREQAIKSFKRGEKRFLISSPVGNRGLDLPFVSLVINYDLPDNIDEYVHRIGRTGRAGHTGRALSFFDEERDREILPNLIEILTEAKQEIPPWMTGEEENTAALDNGVGAGDEWDTAPATNGDTSAPVAAQADEEW